MDGPPGMMYARLSRSLWMAVCARTLIALTSTLHVPTLNPFPPLLFQGITFDEFRSFFQFLNNLEDFAIAMQMYNFASRSIGQGERRRHSCRSCFHTLVTYFLSARQNHKNTFFYPFRWVCESSVCGHGAQADATPGQHHLQDLWCGSRRPALLQGVHRDNEGPAAQRSQGETRRD